MYSGSFTPPSNDISGHAAHTGSTVPGEVAQFSGMSSVRSANPCRKILPGASPCSINREMVILAPAVRTRLVLIGALSLLALAASPVLGTSVAYMVAAFIAVVGIASVILGQRSRSWPATSLGLLGGLVAAGSAIFALRLHSGDVFYGGREVFGWAALLLGLAAFVGALLIRTRPGAAAALLVGGSLLGFVAINLFDINTPYFLAVPLCAVAAALARGGRPQRTKHDPRASAQSRS